MNKRDGGDVLAKEASMVAAAAQRHSGRDAPIGGSEDVAPRNPSRGTLPVHVVRPPKLDEGKLFRLPNRARANSARPRPIQPVSDMVLHSVEFALERRKPVPPEQLRDSYGAAASARAGVSAAAKPPKSKVLEMLAGDNGTKVPGQEVTARARPGKVDEAAGVASWPGKVTTKLQEAVNRKLTAASRIGAPLLRADAVMEVLTEMGRHMPTYAEAFDAVADEMRLLATRLSEAVDETEEVRGAIADVKRDCEQTLARQQTSFRHERDRWAASRDSRDEELEAAVQDVLHMRKRLAEQSIDLDAASKANEDAVKARINFETMATAFAQRNRDLTERNAELEGGLEAARRRADQASAANYQYSQRVLTLEQVSSGDSESHRVAMMKLTEALADHKSRLQRAQATIAQQKEALAETEQTLADCVSERDDLLARLDGLGQASTPRPAFRDRDADYFGQLTSTANRCDSLSNALQQKSDIIADAVAELGQLARAAHLGKVTDLSLRPVAARCPAAALAPVAARTNGRTAPWLVSNAPSLKVPSLTFREAVTLVRGYFTTFAEYERRHQAVAGGAAPPFLELHCVVHHSHQEAHAVQLHAAEASYRVLHAVCASWASASPVVRVFAGAMREELAPWVFHTQNKLIAKVMKTLAGCNGGTVRECKALLATLLRADHFTDPMIAVACGHFVELYAGRSHGAGGSGADSMAASINRSVQRHSIVGTPRASSTVASTAASPRSNGAQHHGSGTPRAVYAAMAITSGSGMASPAAAAVAASAAEAQDLDEDEVCCYVDYDDSRHNPASAVTLTEQPFISVLRRLHVERLQAFYFHLDRELAWQATGKHSPTPAQLSASHLTQRDLHIAIENVLPGLPQTEVQAFVSSVCGTVAVVKAYERNHLKTHRKDIEAAAASIPTRALPLGGLTRWYVPYFADFPKAVAVLPAAVVTAASKGTGAGEVVAPGKGGKPPSAATKKAAAAAARRTAEAHSAVREQLVVAPVGAPTASQPRMAEDVDDFMQSSSDEDGGASRPDMDASAAGAGTLAITLQLPDAAKAVGRPPALPSAAIPQSPAQGAVADSVEMPQLNSTAATSDEDSSDDGPSDVFNFTARSTTASDADGVGASPLGRRKSMAPGSQRTGPSLRPPAGGGGSSSTLRRASVAVLAVSGGGGGHQGHRGSVAAKRADPGMPLVAVLRVVRRIEFCPWGLPDL